MEQETNLPEEEETGILTLTDENGQDANFEYLDCIEYQEHEKHPDRMVTLYK